MVLMLTVRASKSAFTWAWEAPPSSTVVGGGASIAGRVGVPPGNVGSVLTGNGTVNANWQRNIVQKAELRRPIRMPRAHPGDA